MQDLPNSFFYSLGSFIAFTHPYSSPCSLGFIVHAWIVFQYWMIIDDYLLGVSLVFLVLRFIFDKYDDWKIVLSSASIMSLALLVFYNKILLYPSYIFSLPNPNALYLSSIKIHVFWFAFVLLYWFKYFPKDRPFAQYIT